MVELSQRWAEVTSCREAEEASQGNRWALIQAQVDTHMEDLDR